MVMKAPEESNVPISPSSSSVHHSGRPDRSSSNPSLPARRRPPPPQSPVRHRHRLHARRLLRLLLLLPENAPVIAVGPRVLLPPRNHGSYGLFKAGSPHLPPHRLLESALTPEERREDRESDE
ncbi:hypothetical protein EYF80_049585 [Liparis tanakae]|uniref:Uncharacterized protein n=1 Tax=Liparis tanakae TaxID=230148 RepID=A0A4Z2FHJ5_9TELE|nr:hypothetical protein EYF80_049585 [Liparis tanakae]